MVGSGPMMFKDPFSQRPNLPPGQGSPVSPSHATGSMDMGASMSGTGIIAPAISAHTSGGAAWAAPESWGVEGDEEPEEIDTSSSSGSDEDWTECNRSTTPVPPDKRRESVTSVGSGSKQSHHGHAHHHHHGHGHKHRQKTQHNGLTKFGGGDPASSVPVSLQMLLLLTLSTSSASTAPTGHTASCRSS
jgi:hypothetical protein